jgi:hypothetical protein
MGRNLSSFNRVIICFSSNLKAEQMFYAFQSGQSPRFSHNCELSVLNILDLAIYSKQLSKYRFSNIIQSKNNKFNQPIIHKYLSKTHTYHK